LNGCNTSKWNVKEIFQFSKYQYSRESVGGRRATRGHGREKEDIVVEALEKAIERLLTSYPRTSNLEKHRLF